MNAAVGVDLHPDYESALKEMTRLGETFVPDMGTHAIYKELYEKVYLRMYKRLQPFYKAMQAITLPEIADHQDK